MTKKRRKKKKNLYFGQEQEDAVVNFLKTNDDIERSIIYNKYLKKPFDKMIESIINTYKLHRKGYSFEDLHQDTLSFLITKADKFNVDAGKRAYSYYGTICKRYIINLLIKDNKQINLAYSYEDLHDGYIENNTDLTCELEYEEFDTNRLIERTINKLKIEIETNENLEENDIKLGYALIDILDNWEMILKSSSTNNKFNKIMVLEIIRNNTNLTTKEIRDSMKHFKDLYNFVKLDIIEN